MLVGTNLYCRYSAFLLEKLYDILKVALAHMERTEDLSEIRAGVSRNEIIHHVLRALLSRHRYLVNAPRDL